MVNLEKIRTKKYDIFSVALEYARSASKFFLMDRSGIPLKYYKDIFRYAIFTLYGVPTNECCMYVGECGDLLVSWLKNTDNTPKNISKIDYENRMKLAIISIGYFSKFCRKVFDICDDEGVIGNGDVGKQI